MSFWSVRFMRLVCVVMLVLGMNLVSVSAAKLTSEQRKELASIKKNLTKVSLLIRQKKFDEAKAAIDEEEGKFDKLVQDAMIPETDPLSVSTKKLIALRRTFLEKAMGTGGNKPGAANKGVSFEEQIAPILNEKCVSCHGEQRGSANLRLDTFANMRKGGRNGLLLVPQNPNASLIVRKLITPDDNQRMPKNQPALDRDQIQLIARWIAEGARFDGTKETDPIGASVKAKKNPVKVVIATGDEKVSFMNDIAPWMLDFCMRCHSGNNPRSGFSVVTFEDILRGGDTGEVIVPGKPDDSRLWHLVGLQDPIKMPQGQALLKRKNAEDLKTWIAEGAKFDGKDAKGNLREMVPTDEEKRMAELANMSPDEFAKLRRDTLEPTWKRVVNNDPAEMLETDDFIFYGNVSADRLKEISGWATTQVEDLRKLFNEKQKPFWKGKLAVYVFKDRFGYSEFNQTIEDRRVGNDTTWHTKVTPNSLDAYLVLQDVGDQADASSPGLQTNLMAGLTNAAIQRGAGEVPMWASRGLGMLLASKSTTSQAYFESLRQQALEAAPKVQRPEALVAEGTFSPSETTAVGFTLVEFLINNGGLPKMAALLKELKSGTTPVNAVTKVYGTNIRALATAYARTLRPGRVSN
ncbi:c-type cytochrome domain-containing protein [Gimesia sp.]|uniref:c-type cytochrome domain-containing protein n=1 Tax=Gimesia sp. TaxID=2024833 RepID=UPI0032ED2486